MNARLVLALTLGTSVSCRAAPEPLSPHVQVPAQWSAAARASSKPPERWWKEFKDAELDSLVERAVAANLDLSIANARVREARALRDVVAGARLPEIDARASFTRSQLSGNTRQGAFTGSEPRDLYDVGFDATWEIDLFGRSRSALAAVQAGLDAAEEGRADALVTLLGEVARNYVDLRGFQRQIALTRANAEAENRTLELTRSRFQAGLATELDVSRAEALVSTTRAQVPSLEAQASSAVHRLSVLLGQPPASLEPELSEAKPVPVARGALAELAAGVPSDLLRRRPDIRRAERAFAQAAALTDEATADLYPRLTLAASLGLQSIRAGDLTESASKHWSIGPSLFAPIFDRGRRQAGVRVQEARQDAAAEAYRQTVLGALSEVEDALVAVAREGERRELLEKAVGASQRALDLANDLHLRGLIDFFEVLDVQRSQLAAESELARSETALTSRTVALYKALGGGWENLSLELDPSQSPPESGPGR